MRAKECYGIRPVLLLGGARGIRFHGDRESCQVQVVRVYSHKAVVLTRSPRAFELRAVEEVVMVSLHVESASTEFWHVVRWWKTEAEAYRKCRLDVGEEGPPAVWDGVEPSPCVRSGGAESPSLLDIVLIGLDHCIVGHFHGSLHFLHQRSLQLVRCVTLSPFLGVLVEGGRKLRLVDAE